MNEAGRPRGIKLAIALGLYLGFWGAVMAAVAYGLVRAGCSIGLAGIAAFLVFFVLNGAIAYRFRVQQLRREGRKPPPFLVYLVAGLGVKRRITVPRPIRWILGLVILLGGALFAGASLMLLLVLEPVGEDRWLARGVGFLMTGPLAALCLFVGYRLLVTHNDENLFPGRAHQRPAADRE